MKRSPAYRLLELVWKNNGHQMGHSWDRINHAMSGALSLAIESGMQFFKTDFERIAADFRIGHWGGVDGHMLGERFYSQACEGTYGPNMSACQAFEQWKGRKPFLVLGDPSANTKIRVHVGESFKWPDFKKECTPTVHVTSFSEDGTYFNAVERERVGQYREKVKRRFKIDHDKIAEYHTKLRELRSET